MERQFKTLAYNKKVELIDYVKEYVSQHPEVEILVGCDSQNRKRETIYAIVVGLYLPGKGAHVLYSRFTTMRERDNVNRLLSEVWFSVETAEKIKNEVGVAAKWIDIDINPDPKFKSNEVLRQAVGLVEGMGYKVRYKTLGPVVTYAADHLVKI